MRKKPQKADDILLWNDFISGNDEAYALIYEKYARVLFAFGLQITSDRELVKDCIHDIFIKIYRNRTSLNTTDNIRFYLFTTLKNSLYDTYRKNTIKIQQIDELADTIFASEESVEEKYIVREKDKNNQNLINQMMSQLTDRQKEAVYYRFIEGMSIEEISQNMDMTYQSVQNLLQRSIQKMKKYFENS